MILLYLQKKAVQNAFDLSDIVALGTGGSDTVEFIEKINCPEFLHSIEDQTKFCYEFAHVPADQPI
jgi:hypothetical protein